MSKWKRFIATYDIHCGWERRNGHKIALHDYKAWEVVKKFAADFQPHYWVMGGDILDSGPVSHWRRNKPRQMEGLRLKPMMDECRDKIIKPAEALVIPGGKKFYLIGNHEDWIEDYLDAFPQLEGLIDLKTGLGLEDWTVVDQGKAAKIGKLSFVHGDGLSGEFVAKAGVIRYERNLRFGHFHCAQMHSKTSALDLKQPKTGISVPCLCNKDPLYLRRAPTGWTQGFLFGYVHENGNFNDYLAIIVNGKAMINGKEYDGTHIK